MKFYILVLITIGVVGLLPLTVLGQESNDSMKRAIDSTTRSNDSITRETLRIRASIFYSTLIQQLDAKMYDYKRKLPAFFKRDFWPCISAIGNVMQTNSTGAVFGATLDNLDIDKIKPFTKDSVFARSLQINFTPISRAGDLTKYDTLNMGVTYTIINNYTNRNYANLRSELHKASIRWLALRDIITTAISKTNFATNNDKKILDSLFHNSAKRDVVLTDFSNANASLSDPVFLYIIRQIGLIDGSPPVELHDSKYHLFISQSKKNYYYIKDSNTLSDSSILKNKDLAINIIMTEFNESLAIIDTLLKNKPQLNIAFNTIYNTYRGGWQGFYLTPSYSSYFRPNSVNKSWAYSIKGIASIEDDSLWKNTNFQRILFKPTLSINYMVQLGKLGSDSTSSSLEFGGSCEYDLVTQGRYTNEKWSALSPILSITINVTPSLSIPITIKYDTKQNNLFGFLNVQYAFGNSGSSKGNP